MYHQSSKLILFNRLQRFAVGTSALLAITQSASAAFYFVSPTGSDTNPGTTAKPLRTILKAVTLAGTGDNIVLGNGVFTGSGNWDLTISKSITISSLNGAGMTTLYCPDKTQVTNQHFGWIFTSVGGSGGPATVSGITFQNCNKVGAHGGALEFRSSVASVSQCVFQSNMAVQGGAIYTDANTTASISGCTFTQNQTSSDAGGAVYLGGGACSVLGSSFSANIAATGGGALFNTGSAYVSGCVFDSNTSTSAGGGAIYNQGSSGSQLTILVSTLKNNHAAGGSGGGIFDVSPKVEASQCQFVNNISSATGGALYSYSFDLQNCLVVNNSSGVWCADGGRGSLEYCTFTGNGFYAVEGENYARNVVQDSIIWNNGNELVNQGSVYGQVFTVSNSDVKGGYSGTGNIASDPKFIGATGGNFQLLLTTPCLRAGVPLQGITVDLLGRPRPAKPGLGCYEVGNFAQPTAQGVGGDGLLRLLLVANNGQVTLRVVTSTGSKTNYVYGPLSNLSALELCVTADNHSHILWQHSVDGGVTLWDVDPKGVILSTYSFAAPAGFSEAGISPSGKDNHTILLWTNAIGGSIIWSIDATGKYTSIAGS